MTARLVYTNDVRNNLFFPVAVAEELPWLHPLLACARRPGHVEHFSMDCGSIQRGNMAPQYQGRDLKQLECRPSCTAPNGERHAEVEPGCRANDLGTGSSRCPRRQIFAGAGHSPEAATNYAEDERVPALLCRRVQRLMSEPSGVIPNW